MTGSFDFLQDENDTLNLNFEKLKSDINPPQKAQKEDKKFEPIPEGDYKVEIVNSQVKTSKSGNKYLALTLRVVEGDHAKKIIFDHFNLFHPNAKVKAIALDKLGKLTEMVGLGSELKNASDLKDKVVNARIVIRTDINYGDQNKVQYYFSQTDSAVDSLF